MDFLYMLPLFIAIVAVGSYGFYKHAARHTDGIDDIRNATNTLKGLMTAAQVAELEESSGISAAQWGYLGGSSGIDHYVDRGDPVNFDFTLASLITDGTWRELDLSSIIPVGTTLVLLRIAVIDDTSGKSFQVRTNGNVNTKNRLEVVTWVADAWVGGDYLVAPDNDRKVEYFASNTTWTGISLTVAGWWIP